MVNCSTQARLLRRRQYKTLLNTAWYLPSWADPEYQNVAYSDDTCVYKALPRGSRTLHYTHSCDSYVTSE